MQCNFCEKQATVHLSQIVNKKVHKIDLCEECAKVKGVDDPIAYSLAGLAEDLIGSKGPNGGIDSVSAEMTCPECGLTKADFKKTGRLGCPSCYKAFSEGLGSMLISMHKGARHVGKVPTSLKRTMDVTTKLSEMENRLQSLIQEEDYEQAAVLRDEINTLKESHQDLLSDRA